MDTDTSAMLAKYRSRLEEYRTFVAEQEERVASVENSLQLPADSSSANSPAKEKQQQPQQQPTPRQGNGASPPPAAVVDRGAGGPSAARPRSGDSGLLDGRNGSSPAARLPSSVSPRRRANGGGAVPLSAAAARPSPQRRSPRATAHADVALEQQGRYYTSAPPDAMYVKTLLWQQKTQHNVDAVRRELAAEQLSACTFQPRIDPSPARSSRSRPASPGRVDEAVAQHLARLQAARRLRKEREERQARSPAPRRGTLNQLTVPRGPNLGAPVAEPIRSLRKPYVPGGVAAPRTRSTPRAPAPAAAAAVDRWVGESSQPPAQAEENNAAAARGSGIASSSSSVAAAAAAAGERQELHALREQLQARDETVQQQRQRIVALEGELGEVKALVLKLQETVVAMRGGDNESDPIDIVNKA